MEHKQDCKYFQTGMTGSCGCFDIEKAPEPAEGPYPPRDLTRVAVETMFNEYLKAAIVVTGDEPNEGAKSGYKAGAWTGFEIGFRQGQKDYRVRLEKVTKEYEEEMAFLVAKIERLKSER